MMDGSLASVARSSVWAAAPPKIVGLHSLHKCSVAHAGSLTLSKVVNFILTQVGLCCGSGWTWLKVANYVAGKQFI